MLIYLLINGINKKLLAEFKIQDGKEKGNKMAYTIGDGRSIKSLLGGTVKYIIPRYQRKYIWDDKHWQDLYDDLIFVYNNRYTNPSLKHFFSTFIFEKIDSSQV